MRRYHSLLILVALLTLTIAPKVSAQTIASSGPAANRASAAWVDKSVELYRTYFHATASDGTYLYVLGGNSYDGTNYVDLNKLQRYDPATNTWSELAAAYNSSVTSLSGCYLNGKLYFPGGQVSGQYSNGIQIYTIATNLWSSGPDRSDAGYIHGRAVCDARTNRVYIIGGQETSGDSNKTRIYNAATNTWASDGANYPGTVYAHAAGLLSGGRIIVSSGYLNGNASDATYIYSIATDTWTAAANIPAVATFAAYGVGADGKFYVAGGNAGGGATNAVWSYNPISNTWDNAPAMNWPVNYTAGGFVGSLFHVVGGTGYSNDPGCTSSNNICNDNQQLDTDCANVFTDLNGNIFYPAIHNLYCRGVVNGTGPTTFNPTGTSTRAQFAKVTVLGFGVPLANPGTPSFTDVPSSYFAYQYIEGGVVAGILSGFDVNTCNAAGQTPPCYLPNRAITRGQITKIVVSAAGYTLINPPTPTYSDVPTNNIFYQFIETAHAKGVVNGYLDNTFRPNNNIQRDQMCQIVYKGITTP